MNPNDWVMTKDEVGQLWVVGGMYSQIHIIDSGGTQHSKIVANDELYPITKEVADIMRSV